MGNLECIICALAIEEYEGTEWNISQYSGRGMYGKETWSITSDHSAHHLMSITTGYVLGKTFTELAEDIIDNRHLFPNCLEVSEEEAGETLRILADVLDGKLEFVKGVSSDSMGRQTVVY